MRKTSTFACTLASAAALAVAAACGSSTSPAATQNANGNGNVASDVPVTVTADVKLNGYALTADSIVFVFDEATYGVSKSPTSVGVRGSFTAWSLDPSWPLTRSATDPGIWFVQRPLAAVSVPGNCGWPEAKFVVNSETGYSDPPASLPPGHTFLKNLVVLLPGADPAVIAAHETQAKTLKDVSTFDLTDLAQKHTFANFRRVGQLQLFRSYHPYKISTPGAGSATEAARVQAVKDLLVTDGIASIVALSGNEDPVTGESISDAQDFIIQAGHEVFLNTDYKVVYFHSDGADFGNVVKGAVEFITQTSTPAPVLVHCRIGEDRTGVVVAVLAAMAGLPWSTIEADYLASNAMGNGEYRDANLIAYAIQHLSGVDPRTATAAQLKAAVAGHFVQGGYLTQAHVDALAAKLAPPT